MRHIDTIIASNKSVGGTFFDRRTVLYFKNKVLPTMYGGKYFISYDVTDDGEKLYSVREALKSGLIRLVGERGAYLSKNEAVGAVKDLLDETVLA